MAPKTCIVIRGRVWPSSWRRFRDTDYIVNERGEIKNAVSGETLQPGDNGRQYKKVYIGGKRLYVHRIVAEVFNGSPPSGSHQVNHKDRRRDNNSADNLEWVTPSENVKHARKKFISYKGQGKQPGDPF